MNLSPVSSRFALASFFVIAANVLASSGPRYEIAFASFGPINAEIFLADANGNNATPFLPHAGFDGNASFSRDGAWIVFTSERGGSYDIYRAHPDGTALERLVDDPAYDDQAALSPDGNSLAFVSSRSGQADIWILELATRKVRNLTNHVGGDFRPAWSPDGQWIAFSSDRGSKTPKDPAGGFGTIHSAAVFMIRADGSELRRITSVEAFAGSPRWSPDGKRLVFHEAEFPEVSNITTVRKSSRGTTQIGSVNIATKENRTLTRGPGEKWSPRWIGEDRVGYFSGGPKGGVEFTDGTVGSRGEFRCASWSSDGAQMVFHREVDGAWPPFQRWHSNEPQFRLVRTGVFPAYSPAGDTLVCNDAPSGMNSKNLVAMSREGRNRSVFFAGGEKGAIASAWSPNGDRLAFAFGHFFQNMLGRAVADIAVLKRDGTDLKLITDGTGNFGFPSWSPDGRELVYRSSGGNSRGLYIVTLGTGEVRILTPGVSPDNFPAWSPRGDLIAFTSFRDGDYELYTIKPDGTNLRRITHSPGNDAHCAWSPDGEWLAFTSARGGFKDESVLSPQNPQPYGDIYIMRADGSDVRQLTDTPFEEGTVAWAPLSAGR